MATHTDKSRTNEAHDSAVARRKARKTARMEVALADRALARLIREVNAKAGA